jgi:hypothetical protein
MLCLAKTFYLWVCKRAGDIWVLDCTVQFVGVVLLCAALVLIYSFFPP